MSTTVLSIHFYYNQFLVRIQGVDMEQLRYSHKFSYIGSILNNLIGKHNLFDLKIIFCYLKYVDIKRGHVH